jgi:hypothetical protein
MTATLHLASPAPAGEETPEPKVRRQVPRTASLGRAAKRVDPTNAERQRRHRQVKRVSSNVTPTASISDASMRETRRVPWSVYPLAGATVALMGISLTHLSDGVTQLAGLPPWQSWSMAIGIDCMLIAVALALLTAAADVKKDIARVAHAMEVGTLAMSAYLNALAFTGGAFDAAHAMQIAFGCFVPAAISGATFILARLTRRA